MRYKSPKAFLNSSFDLLDDFSKLLVHPGRKIKTEQIKKNLVNLIILRNSKKNTNQQPNNRYNCTK